MVQLDHLRRTRQAADMRRLDSIGHDFPLCLATSFAALV
jgi:hypothetical protein